MRTLPRAPSPAASTPTASAVSRPLAAPDPTARPRLQALAASLCLALFALYLLTSRFSFPVGGDESILFGTVDSLVQRGSFGVDQLASIPKGDPDARSPDWDYGFYGRDGRQYGKSGLGQVLLLAPLEWLALRVPGVGLVNVTMLAGPLVTAATAALLLLVAARLGYPPRVGIALGLLYGLATFAWPHSKTLFPEPPSALALLVALWLLLALAVRPRVPAAAALGLTLGVAFWIKGTNLAVAPAAAAFVAWRLWRTRAAPRVWLALALAGAAPLVLLALGWMAFNWYRFGDPLQAGYDFGFTTPLLHGLWGLLLSPGKGFFWYSPLLLAALPAAPAFLRRHRDVGWLVLAFALLQLPLNATWRVWTGGWAWGPRFLLPATPFVALVLLPLLAWWGGGRAGWRGRALAALAGLSVALQVEGLAVHYSHYLQAMVPLDRVSNSLVVSQVWASPLLGQLGYLRPELLDVAWVEATDGVAVVRWPILVPLLVGAASASVLLVLLARAAGGVGSPAASRWAPSLAVVLVAGCTVLALRAMYLAEDPRERRLVADLDAESAAAGYVFSNWANEASFLNLHRSALPGLGLPDGPRLTRRMDRLLSSFDARTRQAAGASPRMLLQVAQARPGDPDTVVERWLAARAYPLPTAWYGTLRINRYLFLPAPTVEVATPGLRFGDAIGLEQVGWAATFDHGDAHLLPVALTWSRLGAMDRSYVVVLQAVDARGTLLGQSDGVPMGGSYPTSAWKRREQVADHRLVALPAATPPDEYLLVVEVLDPRTGQHLPRHGGTPGPRTETALLGRVRLP